MIKKTLGLILLMILLSSCFIKLDEKETKNESNVKINLSNVSREYVGASTEKITVSLINLNDGKEYLAEGSRDVGTKKNMVLENIPYGNYSVQIKIYESGASEPYSIINSTLAVGKEVATFEGVVGGPNQAANLSGSLEYYEDGYYYVDFECDKVTSNYVSDTTGDTITYKLYGSVYENFRESELLITVTPSDIRHPSNTEEEKIVFKLGRFSSSDPEIPSGIINGGTYYWKVVTSAFVNGKERTCESHVKSVESKKKVVEAVSDPPNKVTESDLIVPINYSINWKKDDGFIFKKVTSANGNDITIYSLMVIFDNNSDDSFVITDCNELWFSEDTIVVNELTSNHYRSNMAKFGETNFTWYVITRCGNEEATSDGFIVVSNLSPNKVDSVSINDEGQGSGVKLTNNTIYINRNNYSDVVWSWSGVTNRLDENILVRYDIEIDKTQDFSNSASTVTTQITDLEQLYNNGSIVKINFNTLMDTEISDKVSELTTYYYKIHSSYDKDGITYTSESDTFQFVYSEW